jgi:hypothetical protein
MALSTPPLRATTTDAGFFLIPSLLFWPGSSYSHLPRNDKYFRQDYRIDLIL